MKEAIKNIGWTGFGLLFIATSLGAFVIFVRGSVWVIANFMDWILAINSFLSAAVLILLLLSIFPRLRGFTGLGIVYASMLWGFLLWLFCIAITYDISGFVGVFIGFMLAGVGIFLTAIGGLFLDGQAAAATILIVDLISIFLIRLLGLWIVSKYKGKDKQISNANM